MDTQDIQTILQGLGLLSLAAVAITYCLDRKWRRAEAAYEFYNSFDTNKDCQLAIFMLDYATLDFEYKIPTSPKVVHVRYSLAKRQSALKKPYLEVSEEERAIRFIFDVYIGYLERVFYLIKQRYFTEDELIFYKYWLDKLVSDDCKDIYEYAKKNSCGMYVPFLERYQNKIQSRLGKMTKF